MRERERERERRRTETERGRKGESLVLWTKLEGGVRVEGLALDSTTPGFGRPWGGSVRFRVLRGSRVRVPNRRTGQPGFSVSHVSTPDREFLIMLDRTPRRLNPHLTPKTSDPLLCSHPFHQAALTHTCTHTHTHTRTRTSTHAHTHTRTHTRTHTHTLFMRKKKWG